MCISLKSSGNSVIKSDDSNVLASNNSSADQRSDLASNNLSSAVAVEWEGAGKGAVGSTSVYCAGLHSHLDRKIACCDA